MRSLTLALSASLMALSAAHATPTEDFQALVEDYETFRDEFGGGGDEDAAETGHQRRGVFLPHVSFDERLA